MGHSQFLYRDDGEGKKNRHEARSPSLARRFPERAGLRGEPFRPVVEKTQLI